MERCICPRCNGRGIIEKYKHVENGVCFECSGSGTVTQEEYTRIQKDIAKEIKKQQKKNQTKQQNLIDSLKKEWFNNSDIIYVLNEKDTFSIKDKLKNDGALWNKTYHVWYFTESKNNYNLFSISWNEVLNDNNRGYAINLTNIIKERSNGNLRGF